MSTNCITAKEARELLENSEIIIDNKLNIIGNLIKSEIEKGNDRVYLDNFLSEYNIDLMNGIDYLSKPKQRVITRLRELGYKVYEDKTEQDMSMIFGSMETDTRIVDIYHICVQW